MAKILVYYGYSDESYNAFCRNDPHDGIFQKVVEEDSLGAAEDYIMHEERYQGPSWAEATWMV